jgi:hypothetical protein
MIAMVAFMYFYLTPAMNALSRAYDFLPPTAALQERENYNHYAVWRRVLEILKALLGIVITGRLVLDRYDWQDKLFPGSSSQSKTVRRRRKPQKPSGPQTSESQS